MSFYGVQVFWWIDSGEETHAKSPKGQILVLKTSSGKKATSSARWRKARPHFDLDDE